MTGLLKKILGAVLLTALCCLALEAFTRAFLKDHSKEDLIPSIITTYDPHLGWANRPNTFASSDRTGQRIEYKINSKGIRGRETSYPKPPGTFRIVLLGDSNTFGVGVPIEKHFSNLLEGYFKGLEVVNMGVQGFGVDQMYLYLSQEGFKYQPDLVVIFVPKYFDFRHMYAQRFGRPKPRFVLDGGRLKLTNYPVFPHLYLTDNDALAKIDYWSAHYSYFYRVIRYLIKTNSPEYKKQASEAINEKADAQNNAEFINKLNTLGKKIIFSASDACKAKGVKFLLVTNIRELFKASEDQDIPALYSGSALNNKGFQLPEDKHFNESGNGVLAWIIAEYLKKSELVPKQYWH